MDTAVVHGLDPNSEAGTIVCEGVLRKYGAALHRFNVERERHIGLATTLMRVLSASKKEDVAPLFKAQNTAEDDVAEDSPRGRTKRRSLDRK